MRNSFFKYTLILVTVFFVVGDILMFFYGHSPSLIYEMARLLIKTNEGSYIPNVFFLLVPLIGLLPAVACSFIWRKVIAGEVDLQVEIEDENKYQKQKRNYNFWKFSFYIYSLLTVAAALAFLIMMNAGMQHKYFSEDNFDAPFFTWLLVTSIVLIASFAIGGLLLGISAIWRTSKVASLINGSIALIILSIAILVVSFLLFHEVNAPSLVHTNQNIENVDTTAAGYVPEPVQSQSNKEEPTNYLSSLWNDPGDDDRNMTDLISYLLKEDEFLDNGSVEVVRFRAVIECDDSLTEEKKYHVIKNFIKNDGKKILATFNSYKRILFRLLPYGTYHASPAHRMIDALMAAYNDIHQKENENDIWVDIYSAMEDGKKKYAANYYDDIDKYTSDAVLKIFTTKDADENVKGDVVWAYSFWARRYHEGNIDAVYDIVSQIQEHYSEDAE
jgi:hypothetical protein